MKYIHEIQYKVYFFESITVWRKKLLKPMNKVQISSKVFLIH